MVVSILGKVIFNISLPFSPLSKPMVMTSPMPCCFIKEAILPCRKVVALNEKMGEEAGILLRLLLLILVFLKRLYILLAPSNTKTPAPIRDTKGIFGKALPEPKATAGVTKTNIEAINNLDIMLTDLFLIFSRVPL